MDSDLRDAIETMRDALRDRAYDISAVAYNEEPDPVMTLAAALIESACEYHWYDAEADRRGLLNATKYTLREAVRVWRYHHSVAVVDDSGRDNGQCFLGHPLFTVLDATPEEVEAFNSAVPIAIRNVDDVAERVCAAMASHTRRIICGVGR